MVSAANLRSTPPRPSTHNNSPLVQKHRSPLSARSKTVEFGPLKRIWWWLDKMCERQKLAGAGPCDSLRTSLAQPLSRDGHTLVLTTRFICAQVNLHPLPAQVSSLSLRPLRLLVHLSLSSTLFVSPLSLFIVYRILTLSLTRRAGLRRVLTLVHR